MILSKDLELAEYLSSVHSHKRPHHLCHNPSLHLDVAGSRNPTVLSAGTRNPTVGPKQTLVLANY